MAHVPYPLIGGSEKGVSSDANPQRTINWYPEYDKSGGRNILRPTPGLTELATLRDEVLGSEMVTNGAFASGTGWTLAAQWSIAGGVLVHAAGSALTASQTAVNMVSAPEVGETYRVTFDVEGISGGILIVTLGGAEYATPINTSGSKSINITATATTGLVFTATTNLAVTLDDVSVKLLTYSNYPLRATLPIGDYLYVVYGPYLKRLDSSFASTTLNGSSLMATRTGFVTMAHIRYGTGYQIMICDGSDKVAYLYDTTTSLFSTLTDSEHEFQGGGSVTSLDDYFLSHGVSTDSIYNSEVADGLSWDAADNTRARKKTSNIQRVYAHQSFAWCFKGDSIEVFYNSGASGASSPTFERLDGGVIDIGLLATWSPASVKGYLFWLASDKTVQMAVGTGRQTVSTQRLSHQIEKMSTASDAVGYCYTEEGHDFYVLSFPTADVTHVYDVTTEQWHERESYNPDRGVDGRHRSNCYAYFQDKHVVGDYTNTKLYELDGEVYTDDGYRIIHRRVGPNINENNLNLFIHAFEVHFEGGVGVLNGQGSSPQAMLRISFDGGHVWTAPINATMGARGGYDTQTIWRRLGSGRDFAPEVSVSDPVKAVVVGAYLDYTQGYA